MKLEIRQGDITNQPDLDAIVNAANTDLILGAGVAGAIRRKGGDSIDREAQARSPIHLGEAVWTTAGRLPNKYVIHAAAMGYRPEDKAVPKRPGSMTSAEIIATATRSALRCSSELGLKSVGFPALGTGVAAFPVEECAAVMVAAAHEFGRCSAQSSVKRVVFVLFSRDDYQEFEKEIERFE